VAVGQTEQDVREFGVYNQDLFNMAEWLEERNIKTIAMESTGTYWQNLYAVLISKGFHVILCNGKFTKNIKGKKSDVDGLPMDSDASYAGSADRQFPS
jgi:transposase